jgi:cell wall-associated NlpC family hydrolase
LVCAIITVCHFAVVLYIQIQQDSYKTFQGGWFMRRIKSPLIVALLLAFCTTLITPAAPAYAFSVSDLLGQTSAVEKASSGNGIFVILVGLLFGKLFSNLTSGNNNTNSVTPNDVLGASVASSTTGAKLINTAKNYMGVPYVWGGETPSGFDCSGFTQYVMKQNGITIPRTAAEQYATGTPVDKSNLRIGDLVFFTTYKAGASHVGFYMGDGNFIHASSAAAKVTISALSDAYYTQHYIGARRYIN